MENRERYLIIAAAGNSIRLGTKTPKQYLNIDNKAVLIYVVEAFLPFVNMENMIIAISQNHTEYWEKLKTEYPELQKAKALIGGPERFHTVKTALKIIPNYSLVAIHDGARPLIDSKTIKNCFQLALSKGSAIPVIDSANSIRFVEGNDNKSLERKKIKLVQTPQTFKSELLKKAYEVNYFEKFTDDASVFEYDGNNIYLTNGNPDNFKITNEQDVELASIILKNRGLST
ncbi:MAG: 2-C-methyl-D-erythritol 4-phosphate cytidylyltransferase [Marinilabiliales bacterium]|nr:MAG: 2-C-methyl-D-erythritol 4-phosphate cytidylyltransferase [Marinilabiliales bacterium]